MTESRRRAAGLAIAIAIFAVLTAYGSWRLKVASDRGWAGFSYVPPVKSSKTQLSPGLPGFEPGSIIFLYPGSPAERAGILRGDRIISINGIPARNFRDIGHLAASLKRGDVVRYGINRAGREITIPVRLAGPTGIPIFVLNLIVTVAVAMAFLIIGAFVFWRRPSDSRATIFFAMTLVAAVTLVNTSLLQIEGSTMRGIAAGEESIREVGRLVVIGAASLFFAPLLLHLSLVFPTPRPVLSRRRGIFVWVYGYPILLCAYVALSSGVLAAITMLRPRGSTIRVTMVSLTSILAVLAIGTLIFRIAKHRWREGILRSPVAVITLILTIFTVIIIFAGRAAQLTHSPAPLFAAIFFTVIGCILTFGAYPVATFVSLFRSYREAGVEERRQVKWPLWGTMVAVGAKVVLSALGFVLVFLTTFGKVDVPTVLLSTPDIVSRLLFTLIPVSFAFAILKYRLMNIDIIIRRTVTYSMLTATVFILYAVLVAGLGSALVKFGNVKNQQVLIASTVVIALVTVPLRNRLQQLVDRNLFRERRDYALALRNIGSAISSSTVVDVFLRASAEQIQQALQNRFVLIAIRRDAEFVAAAKVGIADEIVGALRMPVASVDFATGRVPDPLRKLGAAMIVPASAHRETGAMVALGTRLSDEDFTPPDVEFILAAAAQIGLGIENVRMRDDEADFEQARAMQQILLPKSFPNLAGFRITGLWQPARSVGGDYFDTLTLGDSRAGICIADVAGKGMPAALLMANLQAAVKASASADAGPAAVCERVKSIVSGNRAGGKFISFFYAVLDAPAKTLTYCNAGHNPPVIVRSNGEIERLMIGGPAVCRLFRDAVHEQGSVSLRSGDRVVLFTDGVSEARRGEEEFGEDRLIELLITERRTSATELQDKLISRLREFTMGDYSDDVTFVIIAVE